jgi:hypothetical protein
MGSGTWSSNLVEANFIPALLIEASIGAGWVTNDQRQLRISRNLDRSNSAVTGATRSSYRRTGVGAASTASRVPVGDGV